MDERWNQIIREEVYINDTYGFKNIKFDRDPVHIVDVGANYGWFSYLVAEKYPACNIYAYEFMKDNFEAAKENLNKFEKVQLFNLAVIGDNPAIKYLEHSSENPGGHKVIYEGAASYISNDRFKSTKKGNIIHNEKPPQISIRDIIDINNIDYIDFLKVDCEGCEYEVFDQIFKYDLDKKIKNLSMEVHGKGNPEYRGLNREIEKRFSTCKWGNITIAKNK